MVAEDIDTVTPPLFRTNPSVSIARSWLTLAAIWVVAFVVPAARADPSIGPLDQPIMRYRTLLLEDVDRTMSSAELLRARIEAQDLAGARQAWLAARVGWERSEVFTSGFVPELDKSIDAWPDGTTGFHAIEARLFGAGRLDAVKETDALLRDLTALRTEVRNTALTPQGLLNGIARLAYEVGGSKIDGGESRISGTSIDDMRNNLAGIDLAWRTIFADALRLRDGARAAEVQRRIDDLTAVIARDALKSIDPDELRSASETLVLALQDAAKDLALERPTLD